MSFLWYCLIAKPNNQKGTYFLFMIITSTHLEIYKLFQTIRPPPAFYAMKGIQNIKSRRG